MMRDLGFTEAEFDRLAEAQRNSNALVRTEEIAMAAMKGLFDDGTGKLTKKDRPTANWPCASCTTPPTIAKKPGS